MLRNLILTFDNEIGHAESVFQHALSLIVLMLGQPSADVFSRCIEATEERFYLQEGSGQACWNEMLNKAK